MMMAVFLVFVFLGIPVSFSIGLSTVAAVLAKGMPLAFVSQMAFTGLDSYTYLDSSSVHARGRLNTKRNSTWRKHTTIRIVNRKTIR